MAGAPKGNTNGCKANRVWSDAIRMAIARREKSGKPGALRDLADTIIDKALEGDMTAIKELGDRIDGKAVQSIVGPDNGPIQVVDPTRPQLTKEEWLKAHGVGTPTRTTK